MAEVTINFHQRTYRFECRDQDSERLEGLCAYVKALIERLSMEHGAIGDERIVLMSALMLADELFDARTDIDDLLTESSERLTLAAADLADASMGEAGLDADGAVRTVLTGS